MLIFHYSICGFRYGGLEGSYLGPQRPVWHILDAKSIAYGAPHPNPKGRPVQNRQRNRTTRHFCQKPQAAASQKKRRKSDSNAHAGARTRVSRRFFARPKPHHPTMRLGEVGHSKVSYLCQSPGKYGILAPLSRVGQLRRAGPAAPRTLTEDHKKC